MLKGGLRHDKGSSSFGVGGGNNKGSNGDKEFLGLWMDITMEGTRPKMTVDTDEDTRIPVGDRGGGGQ